MEDVEPVLAGAQVEITHEAVEDQRREASPEDVRAHRAPEPLEPLRTALRGAGTKDFAPVPAGEGPGEERIRSPEIGGY